MSIGDVATLQGLLKYEQLSNVGNGKVILRRSYLAEDQGYFLEAVYVTDLTLWQKIELFFGSRDYSLHTVSKLACKANDAFAKCTFKPPEIQKIHRAVIDLNKKIDKRNSKLFLFRFFKRALVAHIEIPMLASMGASQAPLGDSSSVVARSPAMTRGIRNPMCLCYANASIKGLLFSSGFRKMLAEQGTPQAKLLLEIFAELEKNGEPLSHGSGVLSAFDREIARLFPDINKIFEQQDAEEFTRSILRLVVKEVLLKIDGVKETLESVASIPVKMIKTLRQETVPEVLKGVKVPLINPAPMVELRFSAIVEPSRCKSLQDFFSEVVYPHSEELTSVLKSEANQSLPDEKKEALNKIVDKAGYLPGMEIVEKNSFAPLPNTAWVPPPFLLMQVARYRADIQKDAEGKFCGYIPKKNCSEVTVPFHLSAPVEGREAEKYTLRSVVVHDGFTTSSGHYVTYIPDPTAPLDVEGTPTRWFMQSDSSKPILCSWDMAKHDILTQGYLVFYDHDSIL